MNGTLINYFFHCKRQCYLHGNRLNLEDNSEIVKIGRELHSEKNRSDDCEIAIENIKIDKLTPKYLVEIKKSDADEEAVKWQVYYYLSVLKRKGIIRTGKVEYIEKNKKNHTIYYELTDEIEKELSKIEKEIEALLLSSEIPLAIKKNHCKKCAYFEYCYI